MVVYENFFLVFQVSGRNYVYVKTLVGMFFRANNLNESLLGHEFKLLA